MYSKWPVIFLAICLTSMVGLRASGQDQQQTLRQNLQRYQQELTAENLDQRQAITLLNNIGLTYTGLGQPQLALESYQRALAIAQALGVKPIEANVLNNLGAAYVALQQSQQALAVYQQVLAILQESGNANNQNVGVTLKNIGDIYKALGQTQNALRAYEQALALARTLPERSGEAILLLALADLYGDLEQAQLAIASYQQAINLFRELGDRHREALALNNLGFTYAQTGQLRQAVEVYEPALRIRRSLGDRAGEAVTLNNLGFAYSGLGQLQQALNFYQQALPIVQARGNQSVVAITLTNLGNIYNLLGQFQQALNYHQQALGIFRTQGDRKAEAITLNNIGGVYQVGLKQPLQALDYYQQSLSIRQTVGDRREEAVILNNIGGIYTDIGEPQRAREYYQQALALHRAVGNRAGEATSLSNLAALASQAGQYEQAITQQQQALAIIRDIGSRNLEASLLGNLAVTQVQLQDLPSALQTIQAAIALIEEIRGQLIIPSDRTAYFATVEDYYKLQIGILMRLHQQQPNQGYDVQAFNVSERATARTLIELLAEAKADIRNGIDPQLYQEEQSLIRRLAELDQRRIEQADNPAQVATITAERARLQDRYRALQNQIRVNNPKYAALKYPQPLTLAEIQQNLLDPDTIALVYTLGENQSYLWSISHNSFSSHLLPGQKAIEALVNGKVRPQMTDPRTSRNSFLLDTAPLARILLQPVINQIGNKRLVIIADGALAYIPFGALPDPRAEQYQPLLANHEVTFLPSLSTLQALRQEMASRETAPQTLAVLADPVFSGDDPRVGRPSPVLGLEQWSRLPGTRQEAEAIAKLVPESSRLVWFDFQANRDNALSDRLRQYRFIHWATHGLVNTQKPELSGIIMSLVDPNGQSQNGYLLLNDIFNLNWQAELVVLSACQTGLGEIVRGEGLIGFTRGLMYAGTPRVVTSLWDVDDTATATLMTKFYTKMLQQNLRPAAALRAAQLEMLATRRWLPPYFWAAFTLQGDWR